MIKIDMTLLEFMKYYKSKELLAKAYEFSVYKTLGYHKANFVHWMKNLAPYEEELVQACKTIKPEDYNADKYPDTFMLNNPKDFVPKFLDDVYYDPLDPNDSDMALCLYVAHPELDKFIGMKYELWPDGCVDTVDGIIYTEAGTLYDLTLEEFRLLYTGKLTTEEYIKRHPLEEVLAAKD